MLETSVRLLELLGLMQGKKRWSGPELADRLGVGVRTVRRDIERLRSLGYPVEASPGVDGGYQLAAGVSLPPLLLDNEEAIAIAVGLRTAAGGAVGGIEQASLRVLVKLEQVLPARVRQRVSALSAATATIPTDGAKVDPSALSAIASACRDAEVLAFDYRRRDGRRSHRSVEPHSLVNYGRRWYLVGWDRDRLDWRSFRVDRLAQPESSGTRFTARTLPAEDAAAFVSSGLSSGAQRYEGRVTVHASAEAMGKRSGALWGSFEPIDDQTCEFRTGDDDLEWLALRIAMLGVDCVIHEPAELIEHVARMAGRLSRAVR